MAFDNVLYFSDNQITTQDVLDEISLAISVSGCPLHCKGCHSSFTWDPKFGEELTNDKLEQLIKKNKYISCVLFYGGEWQMNRLMELIRVVKNNGLKVCLYTGLMLEEVVKTKMELLSVVDYIKVGRWIEEKGGLNKKTTNQRFYKVVNNGMVEQKQSPSYEVIEINDNIKLIDWTSRFFQS